VALDLGALLAVDDEAVDVGDLPERGDTGLDEEGHEPELHAVGLLEGLLVSRAEGHDVRHVALVEGGEHRGGVLRLDEADGDALSELAHTLAAGPAGERAGGGGRGRGGGAVGRRGGAAGLDGGEDVLLADASAGPVPCSEARSTWFSSASLRASGVAAALALVAGGRRGFRGLGLCLGGCGTRPRRGASRGSRVGASGSSFGFGFGLLVSAPGGGLLGRLVDRCDRRADFDDRVALGGIVLDRRPGDRVTAAAS
jgi:hypothetical protein